MFEHNIDAATPPCPGIPARLAEITPEWLTDALRSTGTISDAVVASIETAILGEGQGFTGALARINVEYAPRDAEAPRSLIVKLPTANRVMRRVAGGQGIYEREVRFYEQLAAHVSLRTPRRYYSAFDSESGEFVLLLEDLAPARAGDQLAGCADDEATQAVQEVARFHAAWWESARLSKIHWMAMGDSGSDALQQLYQRSWARVRTEMTDGVPDSLFDVGERLGRNLELVRGLAAEPPQTLVHGDFRLDNMFFDAVGGAAFAVVDWQLVRRGRGVFDVAWFLSGCLDPETRRSLESDLLRLYVSTLEENGVAGYHLTRCREDYRLSLLSCLMLAVIASAAADLTTERGAALFETLMRRIASAIDDHQAIEIMPKG